MCKICEVWRETQGRQFFPNRGSNSTHITLFYICSFERGRRGARNTAVQFLSFHTVFRKKWPNIRLILPNPENLGPATFLSHVMSFNLPTSIPFLTHTSIVIRGCELRVVLQRTVIVLNCHVPCPLATCRETWPGIGFIPTVIFRYGKQINSVLVATT